MALTVFDYGLDEIATWTTGTFQYLLINSASYVPAKSDRYVSTTSGYEMTAVSYARATAASKTRTVDTTNHRLRYDAADPSFGAAAAGQTAYGMVLFRFVSTDANSPMIAWYPFTTPTATDGTTFTVTLNSSGVLQYIQG